MNVCDRHGPSGTEAAKQHAASGRVTQQREDQVPMLVEARRPANDRHHAIGACQLEKRIDIIVRQTLRQEAKAELRFQLRSEARFPRCLITFQDVGAKAVRTKSAGENLARDSRADEAVVDAAAGGWLDEAGSVANRNHSVRECLSQGREREHLLPGRRRLAVFVDCLDSPSRGDSSHEAVEIPGRVTVAHQADTGVRT